MMRPRFAVLAMNTHTSPTKETLCGMFCRTGSFSLIRHGAGPDRFCRMRRRGSAGLDAEYRDG